jgi:hypothetical protein
MTKETRMSADRKLRMDHLMRTLDWHKRRVDRVEQLIINNMRSNDTDCSEVAKLIKERDCILLNCSKLKTKRLLCFSRQYS